MDIDSRSISVAEAFFKLIMWSTSGKF